MTPADKTSLREFVQQCSRDMGNQGAVSDDDSLFLGGLLDSLSMTKLVMYLETSHGIDFSRVDFDVEMIDSINLIDTFVEAEAGR